MPPGLRLNDITVPMKPRPSAEELLARVADHDPEAMGELYDRVGPGLLGMLMRILGDRAAAEEWIRAPPGTGRRDRDGA